ncbi:hypothetical protein L1049_014173 [Liquidambar formosana]|uniref:DUF4378 domain-containing protein n=1 Tax=Liquidambar formosana TaxID=63359 RepID=A0AAP0WXE9_LIQFO
MLERSDSSLIIDHESGLTVGINNGGTVIMGELSEDMDVPMEDNCSDPEQEIGFTKNASNELAQPSPVSVLETCFQDDITCPPKSQISEGLELKPRCINFDELNPSFNLQNMSSTDAVSGSCSIVDFENVKNASQGFDNHFLHIELDKKNGADFSYVREILEQSGVIGSEYIGTCPLVDQPLNPAVIEEAEACLPNEPESSGEEVYVSCDHNLLFDLVNEALLEINERSDTYCPRPLSSSCRIHPIPMGYRVLEEVWASISCYLSSRQELEQSFDHVVAQDLAKGDGWMNLQLETECVALELEDIIFDELLGEIICS